MGTESDRRLAHAFLEAHPAEAARGLEQHGAGEGAAALGGVPLEIAAAVVARMDSAHAAAILLAFEPARGGALVSLMPHDAAARVLRRIDGAARAPLLARADGQVRAALERSLSQPPDSAAGLMDARGLSMPADLTAAAALDRARRTPSALGSYVYVVDAERRLVGVASLHELLAAPAEARLHEIMHDDVARLPAEAAGDAIRRHPGWQRYHELPVVDGADVLLGVVRYATARRLERDEASDRTPATSLAPLVAIGELYWVGMARLLGSLLTALGPARANDAPGGDR